MRRVRHVRRNGSWLIGTVLLALGCGAGAQQASDGTLEEADGAGQGEGASDTADAPGDLSETAAPGAEVDAVAMAPETDRDRVRALLSNGNEVYFKIPTAAGAHCQRHIVQVADGAAEEAEPSGHIRQPLGVSWAFSIGPEDVRLHSPSGGNGNNAAWSVACETRATFGQFVHADYEGCAAQAEGFALGACAEALAQVLRPPEPARHLIRQLRRRGRVWVIVDQDAEDGDSAAAGQCVPWDVQPRRRRRQGLDADGELVRRTREGDEETRTIFGYELSGRQLTVLGPSWERRVDGETVEEGGVGCGDVLYVGDDTAQAAELGGARWFFLREACESAAEQGAESTGLGC